MKLTSLRPMLWTKDLQGSIDFYTQVLEFTLDENSDDWGWASLHKDDVHIMLALPNEHTPFDKPTFTGTLYLNTDDVDYWWKKLKDKVKLCYEIEDFEYDMREFAFYDNNGYLLQYGTEIGLPG
ncbi:MAG TPA: VOC family protein [Saprospiraceae bacterium]|nr:VOC family protein [Saprospiraceae bacterium]